MALAEALRHEGRLVIGKVHLQLRWQTGYTPSRVAGFEKGRVMVDEYLVDRVPGACAARLALSAWSRGWR